MSVFAAAATSAGMRTTTAAAVGDGCGRRQGQRLDAGGAAQALIGDHGGRVAALETLVRARTLVRDQVHFNLAPLANVGRADLEFERNLVLDRWRIVEERRR